MIAAGSTLTLDVKGTAGQWIPRTVAELRAVVIDALTPFLHVYDVSVTRESFLSDPENLFYWNWPYVAVVTVQTRQDHGKSEDVASIVAHAFYNGAGTLPSVTVRGFGPQQQPDITTGPNLLGSLTGIAALAVIGLGLWFFGPSIRAALR